MEKKIYCESCGIPMEKEGDFGTNADGSRNEEYCCYCYKNGAYTDDTITMDGMIDLNLKFNEENNYPMGTQEEARKMMESWFPTMKRWKSTPG